MKKKKRQTLIKLHTTTNKTTRNERKKNTKPNKTHIKKITKHNQNNYKKQEMKTHPFPTPPTTHTHTLPPYTHTQFLFFDNTHLASSQPYPDYPRASPRQSIICPCLGLSSGGTRNALLTPVIRSRLRHMRPVRCQGRGSQPLENLHPIFCFVIVLKEEVEEEMEVRFRGR